VELREQCRLDPGGRLVARPQAVAKRLDDMVGRHAHVAFAALEDLQHRLQHAGDGAERPVLALGEAAQPEEVAEQLVGAVDQVDDHGEACRGSAAREVSNMRRNRRIAA
jgi:hypothetical protein